MVVDDEYDITFTLQAGLEDGGFGVDTFTDPELALSNFKSGLYDLVLIDIKMPKINGFVLYELLKTIDPGVKVCFLTAMNHEEMREMEHWRWMVMCLPGLYQAIRIHAVRRMECSFDLMIRDRQICYLDHT
jgi:CheY-like chemotaxis protein